MLIEQYDLQQEKALKNIQKSIQDIQARLKTEVAAKQLTIEHQQASINQLKTSLSSKNLLIAELNTKLAECQRHSEGNRQLVNKLLNDLERRQQDIEWYKRTYETRTIWGVLKDRLLRK